MRTEKLMNIKQSNGSLCHMSVGTCEKKREGMNPIYTFPRLKGCQSPFDHSGAQKTP